MRPRVKCIVPGLVLLAALMAPPGRMARADVIVTQPSNNPGDVRLATEFTDATADSTYEFDDFTTMQAFNLTMLTAFGVETGTPSTNTAVVGRILTAPGITGVPVLSAVSGTQVGNDLILDFGNQLLPAGSYWLTAYVVRPSAGGQWNWSTHLPVSGSESFI